MSRTGITRLPAILPALVLGAAAAPASAQWTRVSEVPIANVYSVWTHGDTITAGSDSTAFVSLDAGATWITTSKLATGVTSVQAVRVHDGLLYGGTFGQGMFVSSDMGATWQAFNQGLVGGFDDVQLYINDLLLRGDTLYASTGGDGPWIRNLAGAGGWSRYGDIFVPSQAGYVEGIGASDTRLVAAAGPNGDVYYRDPGDLDWTLSWLNNVGPMAGLASLCALWTGSSWLVGSNNGAYRSTLGQSPWTYTDFGLHPTYFMSFALHEGIVFTHFANGEGTGIEFSTDDGVTWQVLDAQPLVFTYGIAAIGTTLYAGRVDGLWRRSIATVSAPPAAVPANLHFAIAGRQPVRDEVRFRFELPAAGRLRIDLFDVVGRRVPGGIEASLPAGPHEVRWEAGDLAPGIYLARLSAAGRSEVIRLVRIR